MRGLKERAGCRQIEVQTNKHTNIQTKSRSYALNWRTHKHTRTLKAALHTLLGDN